MLASSVAALALLFFDQTAVIIALPSIAREFGVAAAAGHWIVTAYLLPLAAFMPLAGRLADRHGHTRVLLVGLGIFAIASAACAAAPNLASLVALRFVQGIGGAVVQPLALAAGTQGAPADRRGWLIGVMSTGATSLLVLGPLIAAEMLRIGSWRWLFVVNLPVLVFVVRQFVHWLAAAPAAGTPVAQRDAWWLLAALLTLLLGASQAVDWGWAAGPVLIAGAAVLAAFLRSQLRSDRPMLPLQHVRDPLLGSCLVALFVVQFAVLASMVALVHYLEHALGESVVVAASLVALVGAGTPLLSSAMGRRATPEGHGRWSSAGWRWPPWGWRLWHWPRRHSPWGGWRQA